MCVGGEMPWAVATAFFLALGLGYLGYQADPVHVLEWSAAAASGVARPALAGSRTADGDESCRRVVQVTEYYARDDQAAGSMVQV